jgi:hypothetical protein
MKSVLTRAKKRQPKNLQVDKGTEFRNAALIGYLKAKDINFYTTNNPDTKAAIAERVIRTIKGRIARYMTHNNTLTYVPKLQDFADAYNRSKHRTIGMAPADVSQADVSNIKRRLYPASVAKPANLNVNQQVRLAKERGPFQKGYAPGWTEEVFTISKVIRRNPPVYKVKDYLGEELEGTFYETEVQEVIKTPDDVYKVERIIDRRKNPRGTTEYLVKWLGYPESMSTWEPESNISII